MILHICQPLIDPNSTMDINRDNPFRQTLLQGSLHLSFGRPVQLATHVFLSHFPTKGRASSTRQGSPQPSLLLGIYVGINKASTQWAFTFEPLPKAAGDLIKPPFAGFMRDACCFERLAPPTGKCTLVSEHQQVRNSQMLLHKCDVNPQTLLTKRLFVLRNFKNNLIGNVNERNARLFFRSQISLRLIPGRNSAAGADDTI